MRRWNRYGEKRFRAGRPIFATFVTVLALCLMAANAFGARSVSRRPKPEERGRIYQFLVSNGIPIRDPIRVAKVSAVTKTRQRVRSIVKIITPEKIPPGKMPSPKELEEIRKRVRNKMRTNQPIRFGTQTDLLRLNIVAGEVVEFHPSEKLGELEIFFSRSQSLKIEIGTDLFLIRIGNRYCAFRSPHLRKQLSSILEPRKVKSGGKHNSRSRRGRSPR